MKLYSLLKNINCRVFGNTNIVINGLYHKDTEVKDNGLFFCLRGTRVDGKNYILSAIKNGATAIVAEQEIPNLPNITQIIVKNARETMSLIACVFYGNPAKKLKIIGVTGTNGKTTITTLLFNILNNFGKKCAIIGTNGIIINGQEYESSMTTPDPIELQKYFSIMTKKNIEFVCMEVSAHALALKKVEGFKFEQVIFTNLSEDHLDYFKSLDNYFKSKAELFSLKHAKVAIININDVFGKILVESIKMPLYTYSINENIHNSNALNDSLIKDDADNKSDYTASNLTFTKVNSKFILNKNTSVTIPLLGSFNVSNSLAVIASLNLLGFNEKLIVNELTKVKPAEGRFNVYSINDINVVIDYAHTPDGLLKALETCRYLASEKKVIAVFGCGGNREQEKRKIMGEIACKCANFTIITSDNPRFEQKEKIAKDIENGFTKNNYKIILDRKEAIKNAISLSKSGDFVLIAGKGAERYMEENGEKVFYSDYEVIKNLINNPK